MTSIKYYENYFPEDLINIKATLKHSNGISIHSFISASAQDHFGQTRKAFLHSKSKYKFLFSFFYTVLLDQVIHFSLHDKHSDFENISGYPKFVGILSSYGSNMDPALILLIATVYLEGEDKDIVTEDFADFTEYILEDYADFFYNIFPQYTTDLYTKEMQEDALIIIFENMKLAMNWESVQKSINIITPDLLLYKNWINIFNMKVDEKLFSLS